MLARILTVTAAAAVLGAACTARAGAPSATGFTPAIVDPAVAIQASLAKDSLAGVHGNAATIEQQAAKLQPPAPDVVRAATTLKGAADLAAARQAFGGMSEALVAYIGAQKLTLDPAVHIAYCSMVFKPWLQKGTVIANPYYGSQMPTCGTIKQ